MYSWISAVCEMAVCAVVSNQSDVVRDVRYRHHQVRRTSHDHSLHSRLDVHHVQMFHLDAAPEIVLSHAHRTYSRC